MVSLVLAVPVMALSMIPVLQFDNWQWLSCQLASPVVRWGGWPFHRAAWLNLRHGAATMDTLISVGVTLAAYRLVGGRAVRRRRGHDRHARWASTGVPRGRRGRTTSTSRSRRPW